MQVDFVGKLGKHGKELFFKNKIKTKREVELFLLVILVFLKAFVPTKSIGGHFRRLLWDEDLWNWVVHFFFRWVVILVYLPPRMPVANELVFPSWDISWELTNIHLANGINQWSSNSGNIHPLGWDSRSNALVVRIASLLGGPDQSYN